MPDGWSVAQVRRALTSYPLAGPVLDVGAGAYSSWFRPIFAEAGLDYVALDRADHDGIDVVGDVLDYRERGWGTVCCLSVAEHAEDPARLVRRCRALLRRGGYLLFGAPICWEFHEYPHDYWRILPDGVRLWLNGMEICELVCEAGENFTVRNQLFAVARKITSAPAGGSSRSTVLTDA